MCIHIGVTVRKKMKNLCLTTQIQERHLKKYGYWELMLSGISKKLIFLNVFKSLMLIF